MELGQKIAYAITLGTIAIAAAPPTTLLVVKELDAEGPLTHLTMVFLAIGTIVTLTLSQVFAIVFTQAGVWHGPDLSLNIQLFHLFLKVFGSLGVGIILGFILSLIVEREKKEGEVLLAVICIILFGQSMAHFFHTDPLLTALFTGFALVNFAPTGMNIHKILKDAGSTIFAFFFILAGSHIHLQQQLQTVGILGFGYIIARTFGVLGSSYIAAKISKEPKVIGKYLGSSVLSHAGAALAIALTLSKYHSPSAQTAMTVVIGSIFFFELVGPLTLKHSLKVINEVNASSNPLGTPKKVIHSPKELFITFLLNIGIIKDEEIQHDQSISHFICRNALTINEGANFNQVIKFINDHQMPSYPVVDNDGLLIGTISFTAIKRAKGQFNVNSTATARELAVHQDFLREDQTIVEAMRHFDNLGVAALPIVRKGSKKLIGILHYKDLLTA
jgi:predicted transcriptional regulator/energy-converting hydrogenase Eha subunit E